MTRIIGGVALWAMLIGAAIAPQEAPATAPQALACPLPEVPTAERPVKPSRPEAPRCIDEARGIHTCRNNVLTAYQTSLVRYEQSFNTYVAEVNGYISKLEAYTRQTIAYAECERRMVAPTAIITG